MFVLEGDPLSSRHGYPDKNDLHIHAAMVEHNIDYLVTNDKALLDYWETNENTDEPLPYETISADDLLMTYTENSFGRADRNGESDLCGALERADAPRFAHYLRHHIIPHLPE